MTKSKIYEVSCPCCKKIVMEDNMQRVKTIRSYYCADSRIPYIFEENVMWCKNCFNNKNCCEVPECANPASDRIKTYNQNEDLCDACWGASNDECHLCGSDEHARNDMFWRLGGDCMFGFCENCEKICGGCDIELPIDEKTKKLLLTFQ